MKMRVYYEDTDCGGIVYHSNYLKFCERARSEFVFQKGVDIFNENAHFVVNKITANFKKSAKLGDIIEVKTKVLNISHASVCLEQQIFRDDELLFEAQINIVFLRGNKPSKITQEIKELFLQWQ